MMAPETLLGNGEVRRISLALLPVAVALMSGGTGSVWAEAPRIERQETALSARERGSKIVFHGWSPDSRLVAYTRQRNDGQTERVEQRMHRFVKRGAFAGFGRMVGGDVARYALDRGYVNSPLTLRRVSPTRLDTEFEGHSLSLVFDIGEAHGWKFFIDGVERTSHRFDRIYIGFDVEISPSPDGRQAVMVMDLDTGWEIDAAVFAISLESD